MLYILQNTFSYKLFFFFQVVRCFSFFTSLLICNIIYLLPHNIKIDLRSKFVLNHIYFDRTMKLFVEPIIITIIFISIMFIKDKTFIIILYDKKYLK